MDKLSSFLQVSAGDTVSKMKITIFIAFFVSFVYVTNCQNVLPGLGGVLPLLGAATLLGGLTGGFGGGFGRGRGTTFERVDLIIPDDGSFFL